LTLDSENKHNLLAERITGRLKAVGKSATAVSRAIGKKPDFIRDFLTGRKSGMGADALAKIARELGVTVAWLQGDDSDISPPATEPLTPRTVSVFGSTAGTGAGLQHITSNVVEWLQCPQGLAGVRDVYALYVGVATMEPRFRQGDLVIIAPHRPPSPGDDVVVTLATDSGEPQSRIAQFTGERDGKVGLRQHNPPLEILVERSGIVEIQRIAPINDLVGR